MSRIYTASMSSIAIDAAAELFFIEAPADSVLRIHEIKVTQDASVTSEQLPLKVYRTATDQGAKGTEVTPSPLSVGDPASTALIRSAILTAATFATPGAMLLADSQNMLNGFHILPTPETRIDISPGEYLVIKLDAAPTASLNISGYVTFEEIGG